MPIFEQLHLFCPFRCFDILDSRLRFNRRVIVQVLTLAADFYFGLLVRLGDHATNKWYEKIACEDEDLDKLTWKFANLLGQVATQCPTSTTVLRNIIGPVGFTLLQCPRGGLPVNRHETGVTRDTVGKVLLAFVQSGGIEAAELVSHKRIYYV